MIGFVASARRDRLRAIRDAIAGDDIEALACGLRRVLFTDRDAAVRAAAARRLGELATPTEAWLQEALADDAPMVREATLRALAHTGTATSTEAVRELVTTERVWWVRRSAVYTLAAIAGAGELVTFKAVLGDPFWRVRHAAVKVLAVLGARDAGIRDELIAEPPQGAARSALEFLRASWGPVGVEATRAPGTASRLPTELLDADPAVVTARLVAAQVEPIALVELLSDPHVPLRLRAVERLIAMRDRDAFRASLDWLEEPRIPHVAECVEHMLAQLGDDALEVATAALARIDRPRAASWAITWAIATHSETLYPAALAAADRDPSLRVAAMPIASLAQLQAWAAAQLDAVAIELHERRAYALLLALDATDHPAARALQIDAAARSGAWERVTLDDPHHGPRAVAAHWLVRTGRSDGRAMLADRDPSVREAALANPALATTAIHDRDPWVARAAAEQLAVSTRGERELSGAIVDAALAAHGSRDPWIRAQACSIPRTTEALIEAALTALVDAEEMVRSAALEAIQPIPSIDARLATWVEHQPAPVTRIETREPVARPVASVAQRTFGRAGFSVAPLAISGAFDLSLPALHTAAEAGVNTWFWEPAYENLTAFLRARPHDHVITGSYHADATSIEADVERALRKLRRTQLDVLLLFWARSPARVDAEAYAAIEHLKRSGKVRALGFSTHHRELARTAIETSPWDCVMIRHSAAHPGIETELLATARAHDTAIITFSALTYGRMISGPHAPSPADCYRYSLSQPGVTACISAPRRRREVVENLDVLAQPLLDEAQLAALRRHGLGVRAENQRFNSLLRQPTRDAAAAARELLASELPPTDVTSQVPLPRASESRPARTGLGKTRSRR